MKRELREHQKLAIEQLRDSFRSGFKKPLLVCPTGGGKTDIISAITRVMFDNGKKILIAAHRKEIIYQICERLEMYGVHAGIIMAGHKPNLGRRVQVASKDSYYSRKEFDADLVIIDEAHRAKGKSYDPLTNAKLVIGFTATPVRPDGKSLGDIFDAVVMPITMSELIARGFLVPAQIWSPKEAPNLDGVHTRMGEFVDSELFDLFNTDRVLNGMYDEYMKIAPDTRAILFNVNVKHSQVAAEFFKSKGIAAEVVYGNMPDADRNRVIKRFKRGEIQLLSNCNLVGEGFDLPECETLIMNTSTKSETKWMQAVGRVIRASPGKTHGTVIDLGGCALRFGMPEDYDRFGFSFDEEKKIVKREAPTKCCPNCDMVLHTSVMLCPNCGYKFVSKTQDKIYVDEVGLKQLDRNTEFIKKVINLKNSSGGYKHIFRSDMASIRTVAKICGYSNGWIMHTLVSRGLWNKSDERNYGALFKELERQERKAGMDEIYQHVCQKFKNV